MAASDNYMVSVDNDDRHKSKLEENRLQETQAEVDEILDIMKDNVEGILKRGENLTELDERAETLNNNAKQFENQACKLKRKYWWENTKMMVYIGVIVVFLLAIVIGK